MTKERKEQIDKVLFDILSFCDGRIPSLCLYEIAKNYDITIKEKDKPHLSKTKGACGITAEGKAVIAVNNYRHYQAAENLTIAHELGHILLNHYELKRSIIELSVEQNQLKKSHEEEAWYFAYELIVPKDDFTMFFGCAPFDYATICAIAERYKISKFAAAARFVNLSTQAFAVVQLVNCKIEQFSLSALFSTYMLKPVGTNINENKITNKVLNKQYKQIDFEIVPKSDWLQNSLSNCTLLERVYGDINSAIVLLILKRPSLNEKRNL